jgi:hypothetical protein
LKERPWKSKSQPVLLEETNLLVLNESGREILMISNNLKRILFSAIVFLLVPNLSFAVCTYEVSPQQYRFGPSAGTGSVVVTPSSSSCAWTATKNADASWITIASGASGTGSGTVTYNISTNNAGDNRTGSIFIAGKTITIIQYAVGYNLKGDTNNDWNINLADAIVALQIVAGQSPPVIHKSSDVNGDGKIGLQEALYILQTQSSLTNTVNVTSANVVPYDASRGAVVFNIHPTSTFTYNVDKFAAGDKLVFDAGTALSVTNISGTDGVIDVVGSLSGQIVTVHLTWLDLASDGAIYGVNSFNTVFGPGSLVAQ